MDYYRYSGSYLTPPKDPSSNVVYENLLIVPLKEDEKIPDLFNTGISFDKDQCRYTGRLKVEVYMPLYAKLGSVFLIDDRGFLYTEKYMTMPENIMSELKCPANLH